MSEEELVAIRDRAARATPGPWWMTEPPWGDGLSVHAGPSADPHTGVSVCWVDVMDIQFSPAFDHLDAGQIQAQCVDNIDFIAHARSDVPALIKEVERLSDRISELEYAASEALDQLEWYRSSHGNDDQYAARIELLEKTLKKGGAE